MLCKSMDQCLYDRNLHRERVKHLFVLTTSSFRPSFPNLSTTPIVYQIFSYSLTVIIKAHLTLFSFTCFFQTTLLLSSCLISVCWYAFSGDRRSLSQVRMQCTLLLKRKSFLIDTIRQSRNIEYNYYNTLLLYSNYIIIYYFLYCRGLYFCIIILFHICYTNVLCHSALLGVIVFTMW